MKARDVRNFEIQCYSAWLDGKWKGFAALRRAGVCRAESAAFDVVGLLVAKTTTTTSRYLESIPLSYLLIEYGIHASTPAEFGLPMKVMKALASRASRNETLY